MHERQVLIVDDSLLFSKFIEGVVNSLDGYICCGISNDAYDARDKIEVICPDIIILDIFMPKMDGISFIKQLIPQYTVPIIICSSRGDLISTALKFGAADFIEKPNKNITYQDFKDSMKKSLNTVIALKKIKCGDQLYDVRVSEKPTISDVLERRIIAIGGSTGSTEDLPKILKDFDSSCPPIVVVLHMPEGYTSLYAKRLDKELDNISVVEARSGIYLKKGMVVIAEGDKHLRVFKDSGGYYISSDSGIKVSGHCPSVDVLFLSVAACAGADAIGVILTGMGSDGAIGLKKMRDNGAFCVGQDEASCAVYGMPKVAFEIGAVNIRSDIYEIAFKIKSWLNQKGS